MTSKEFFFGELLEFFGSRCWAIYISNNSCAVAGWWVMMVVRVSLPVAVGLVGGDGEFSTASSSDETCIGSGVTMLATMDGSSEAVYGESGR